MNLYLIGYRGCGKSTVAPLLARCLERHFVDSDQVIEEEAGIPISQIFSDHGEANFRERETATLKDYPAAAKLILSLGGGAPLAEANRQWLKENGKTVWLQADPEVLWERIRSDKKSASQRPNLTEQGGLNEVRQVLEARTSVYEACADYTIDVTRLSPEQIADQVASWWSSVDSNQEP